MLSYVYMYLTKTQFIALPLKSATHNLCHMSLLSRRKVANFKQNVSQPSFFEPFFERQHFGVKLATYQNRHFASPSL